jgi:UrcA family protein
MTIRTHIAIAFATITAIAAPAQAKDHMWQVGADQIHVVLNGADASTVQGRAALLAAAEKAAGKLCAGMPTRGEERACVENTLKQSARGNMLAVALVERNGVALAAR